MKAKFQMTQNPKPFNGQASIHSDAVVRNLMAKTGLDDYLNREGVTEVLINREPSRGLGDVYKRQV